MSGDPKEGAVISARVEAAHVKVPMVVGYDQQVSLNIFTLTSQEPAQQLFISGDSRFVNYQPANLVTSQFFMQTDETVGISGAMQRLKPFKFGVPFAKPVLTILIGHLQLWIFENLQRQAGTPGHRLKMQVSRFILCQVSDRKVTKTQLPASVFARQNQGLLFAARANPDNIRRDVNFAYQWFD